MNHEQEFIRAINKAAGTDGRVAELVYADWLLECGREGLAEAWRVVVGLDLKPCGCERFRIGWNWDCRKIDYPDDPPCVLPIDWERLSGLPDLADKLCVFGFNSYFDAMSAGCDSVLEYDFLPQLFSGDIYA